IILPFFTLSPLYPQLTSEHSSKNTSMPANTPQFCGLPTELRAKIVGHLAEELPPSVRESAYEPSIKMIESRHQPLKALSLCSKHLNDLTFEHIFGHVAVKMRPFHHRTTWNLWYNADPCLRPLYECEDFLRRKGLMGKTMTLTIYFPRSCELGDSFRRNFVKKLGNVVMGINPQRLTIIASSQMMGALCNIQCGSKYQSPWDRTHQALSLGQPRRWSGAGWVEYWPEPTSVLSLRHWSTVQLNEDPAICLRESSDPPGKKRPSILNGYDHMVPWMWPDTFRCVRHFEYVAHYPGCTQIELLAKAVKGCRILESFTTQLVPLQPTPADTYRAYMNPHLVDPWSGLASSYTTIATWIATDMQHDLDKCRNTFALKKWYVRDDRSVVDPILASVLRGWESNEPGVWEKVETPRWSWWI
ncbi:MAG: hypothetical protein Q9183_003005, partial [Haloplaca sp. 2 TL-2023]